MSDDNLSESNVLVPRSWAQEIDELAGRLKRTGWVTPGEISRPERIPAPAATKFIYRPDDIEVDGEEDLIPDMRPVDPYACLQVVGFEVFESRPVFQAARYKASRSGEIIFNGRQTIERNSVGVLQEDTIIRVLRADEDPPEAIAYPDRWGPVEGEFYLEKGSGNVEALVLDENLKNTFFARIVKRGVTIHFARAVTGCPAAEIYDPPNNVDDEIYQDDIEPNPSRRMRIYNFQAVVFESVELSSEYADPYVSPSINGYVQPVDFKGMDPSGRIAAPQQDDDDVDLPHTIVKEQLQQVVVDNEDEYWAVTAGSYMTIIERDGRFVKQRWSPVL